MSCWELGYTPANLRGIMEKHKLTKEAIADTADVSVRQVHYWLSGAKDMPLWRWRKLVDYTNPQEGCLITGESAMKVKSINQHTTLECVHVIRYNMESGSELFKNYPDHIVQGMTKKDLCARKMFFHNTAMMDDRESELNDAQLDRLVKQIEELEK